jgi:hypothetical protein
MREYFTFPALRQSKHEVRGRRHLGGPNYTLSERWRINQPRRVRGVRRENNHLAPHKIGPLEISMQLRQASP